MLKDIIETINMLDDKIKNYLRLFAFAFLLSILFISIENGNIRTLLLVLKELPGINFIFEDVFLKIYMSFLITISIVLFFYSILDYDQMEKTINKINSKISENKVQNHNERLRLVEIYKNELKDTELYKAEKLVLLVDTLNMIIVVVILGVYIWDIEFSISHYIAVSLFLGILLLYFMEAQKPLAEVIQKTRFNIDNFENYNEIENYNNSIVTGAFKTFKRFRTKRLHLFLLITLIIVIMVAINSPGNLGSGLFFFMIWFFFMVCIGMYVDHN